MVGPKEYFLSKGFDLPTAKYYANGRRKIVSVTPNDDFTLILSFDNGERRLLDVKPMLMKGTVFEPFCDIANFKRVYLDAQHCVSWDIDPTVDSETVWNNKVDLCPDSCYINSVPMGGAARA